jgi:Cof subfamily protein (haloacid dehalogenase superfamily)
LSIRLLALDIDGTLLDSSGQVPAANRAAVQRAIDAGIDIALATGRRYEFARPIFEQLPAPLTLILSNGAIVKTRDGRTLTRRLLPRDTARAILERTPDHRGSAAVIFDRPRDGQVVFQTIDWEHPRQRRFLEANRPFVAEVSPLEAALTEDPVQVMFTGPCETMRELFARLLWQSSAGGNGYAVALTEYRHTDFSLVDIVQAGCSKGSTLQDLARQRGISAAEVMAIGDNLNDLEMLTFAGQPVVMGNAVEDLKTRGWPVTGTNDEAGAAQAIETFVFGRRHRE